MDIIALVKVLVKRLPVILGCSVLLATLVIFFTMNMPKEYVSEAVVYTGIRTGFSPDNITQTRFDQTANYVFDNFLNIVKSRETLKEVGLRLMALHISLDKADPKIISTDHFTNMRQLMPPHILGLREESVNSIYHKLDSLADSDPFLLSHINYPSPYYSIAVLSKVTAARQMSSDMVKMSYVSDDQGVSKNTLEILIDVSIKNFRKINEGQSDSVVSYFERQLAQAKANLIESEEKYLQFKQSKNLVNYNVQTSMVIAERQNTLDQIYKAQEVLVSSEAAIKNIESQLGTQSQNLKNREILEKREQLNRKTNELSTAELNNASSERITSLQSQIDQIKDELNQLMTEISASLSHQVSGSILVSEYTSRIISYEESKARLNALENRRNQAMAEYERFLPLGDELTRIEREIDIQVKTYYEAMQNLYQSKMKQQNQQSVSTIQVIDKPNYPLMAKPTNRKLLVIIGSMIGFSIPAMIFLLIAFFDKNIRTIQRAEELTGLKSGGIFPNIKVLSAYKNSEQISDGLSDTILKNTYLTNNSGQQRILIISTRPAEGKTTISNLLCERIIHKGRKCLVVVPYLDSGSWSVVSYKVDNAFFQSKAEDLVPVERLNDTDVLILELPSLIIHDYPVELIKQFNIAFLICDANREWTKADQTALDGFIKISGITPYLILNDVDKEAVEEVLGKVS